MKTTTIEATEVIAELNAAPSFAMSERAAPQGVMQAVEANPAALLHMAMERGASLDQLERLIALQERWEATEARKAFHGAMAAFRLRPLTITKDKHVSFTTQKGKTEYDHATLGHIVKVVVPALSEFGLSHSWEPARTDNGRIKVTCKVTHKQGHSESVTLDAAPDESGGKNSIQAVGSVVSYLQRYTLLAILGLATEDQDDDGKGDTSVAVVSEQILDGLLKRLDATTTDADALGVWRVGRDSIEATKNIEGLNELRQRVEEHRAKLRAAAKVEA